MTQENIRTVSEIEDSLHSLMDKNVQSVPITCPIIWELLTHAKANKGEDK